MQSTERKRPVRDRDDIRAALAHMDGLDFADIALLIGCCLSAVETRIKRGLDLMKGANHEARA